MAYIKPRVYFLRSLWVTFSFSFSFFGLSKKFSEGTDNEIGLYDFKAFNKTTKSDLVQGLI